MLPLLFILHQHDSPLCAGHFSNLSIVIYISISIFLTILNISTQIALIKQYFTIKFDQEISIHTPIFLNETNKKQYFVKIQLFQHLFIIF